MRSLLSRLCRYGALGAMGLTLTASAAQAQSLLERSGALEPMRDEYVFAGEAGQTVMIQMSSADFDTVVALQGPDGAELESNDDYGGTLNSTIVITLPEAGEYTVVAGSFSGMGGTYDLLVRTATEYEQVYDRAIDLMMSEDYGEAIEAFTASIALDNTNPDAFLGRANAYWGQTYLTLGETFQSPDDFPPQVRAAIVADYEAAAALYEQRGETDYAMSLRAEADYVRTGEYSEQPL